MTSGNVTAATRDDALRQLRAKGLTPLDLDETGATTAAKVLTKDQDAPAASLRAGVVRFNDVHDFTSELSIMLRAGLPLDRSLRILIGMDRRLAVSVILEDLLKSVKSGKGLSQALARHQSVFGEFFVNMVRSGEAGGQLAEVLSQLAEHMEGLKSLRESVVSALIYPAILVVVALVSVFLLLGFVVPQFESVFADMGDALPLPTRLIVASGHFVADWGWLLVLLLALCLWWLRQWLATEAGRRWRDEKLLSLPIFGMIVRKYELTRFTRSLGTLLGNGVPIVQAVRIASETMTNQVLRDGVAGVAPELKQGGRMADALEKSCLFTPLALNMIRLGEETGRLDAMLLEVARVHDVEVKSGVKRALTLVEPVLILGLGLVIAAIIISILLGIMSVNELAI